MSISFDLSGDFLQVVDGLEAVTIEPPVGEVYQSLGVVRQVNAAEVALSGGVFTAADVVWHLPDSLVSSDLQVGTTITDSAGHQWTALATAMHMRGKVWCVTGRAV